MDESSDFEKTVKFYDSDVIEMKCKSNLITITSDNLRSVKDNEQILVKKTISRIDKNKVYNNPIHA